MSTLSIEKYKMFSSQTAFLIERYIGISPDMQTHIVLSCNVERLQCWEQSMHDANVGIKLKDRLLEDLLVFAIGLTGRNAFSLSPGNIWKIDCEIVVIDQHTLKVMGLDIFEKFVKSRILFDVIVIDGERVESLDSGEDAFDVPSIEPLNSLESLLVRLNRAEASGRPLYDWIGVVKTE